MASNKPIKDKAVKAAPDVVRPLSVTERLDAFGIDTICERVANCEFLENIAVDCGVSRGSLVKWLTSDAHNAVYARAREAQADKMAEDILSIADDGGSDTYVDSDGKVCTDQEVIARSRLRVDARKWLASKMAPRKYGEKLAIGGADDLPAIQSQTTLSDEQLAHIASASRG